MAKVFPTPKYINKVIEEIINSPEIQNLTRHKDISTKEPFEEPEKVGDEQKVLFKLWLIDQFKRYPKVYRSIESHFIAHGKILPPELSDFMKWFVKHARQSKDYLSIKIEDSHFNLFHEERVKSLSNSSHWDGLYKELTGHKFIKTTPEIFNYVMEYKQLPGGEDKIQWRTSNADALAFQSTFRFKMTIMNICFRSKSGKPFTGGSKPTVNRKEPLPSILERYKTLIEK